MPEAKNQPDQKKKKVFAESLMSLPPEKVAALDSFLLADYPIDKLVKVVKEEWGLLTDMADMSLRRMLYRYKAREIKTKQAKLAAKHTSDVGLQQLVAKVNELEDRLNPVLLLEEMVIRQKARIDKLAKTETKAPTLLESQTKNIALMTDMLTRLINAQLEVGVLMRVPKKMRLETSDLTAEERKFMETAKLAGAESSFMIDAMRLLKDDGVIDVQAIEVRDRDVDRNQGD